MAHPSTDVVCVDRQTAENTNRWMFGRCDMDLFQRDEQRIHENVSVGNSSPDD